MRVMSDHHVGASRAMRRPQISSSQKSVKTPRRRRRTARTTTAATALRRTRGDGRAAEHVAADSVRAELPRRHAESHAELLAEVVLGGKAGAARGVSAAAVAVL